MIFLRGSAVSFCDGANSPERAELNMESSDERIHYEHFAYGLCLRSGGTSNDFRVLWFTPFQGRSSVVEQRPFKPLVVGSIPTAPTSFLIHSTGLAETARQQKAALRNLAASASKQELAARMAIRRFAVSVFVVRSSHPG
jgi:hypothetical protein